jgi:hypothetical protein
MPLDDRKISPLQGSDDENLKVSRDANTKGDTDGNGDNNADEYNNDENLKRQQQKNEDDNDDDNDVDENFKQQQQEEKDAEDNDDYPDNEDDEDDEDDADIINDKYDDEIDENDDEDEEDDEDDDEEDNDDDGQGKLCINNKNKILGTVKCFVFENKKKRAASAHDSSPKDGTIHKNEPGVKKQKLQREQIVIGLNDTSDKSRDISRWKNEVMTPSVKKIFEEDLKTWTPSFAFMVSSVDNY